MYKKAIAVFLCTTALLNSVIPVYADEEQSVPESASEILAEDSSDVTQAEAVPYTSQAEGPLSINVVYSTELEAKDGDLIEIQLLNAQTEEIETISFDASLATSNDLEMWLPKGEYLVKNIKYTGTNKEIKNQILATTAAFTIGDQLGVTSETTSSIIIGIGEKTCNAVKENYKSIRTSEDFEESSDEVETESQKETKVTQQKAEKKVYEEKTSPFFRLIPLSIIAIILFGIAFKWHKDGKI